MTRPFEVNDCVVACSIYGTYKTYKVAGIRRKGEQEQLFVVSGESQVWADSKLFDHLEPHFVVGDKVVVRPRNHPGHRNDHICTIEHLRDRTQIVSRVIRNPDATWIEFEGDTTPSVSANGKKSYRASRFRKANSRSVKPPLPNQAWATAPEPLEHAFKVGDRVVTRPHDHPGHRKRRGDANLVAYLDGKILTITEVSTVNCTGYIKLKEDSRNKPHWASRFQPVPEGFKENPFHYPFKIGDRVVTRPHDHPGRVKSSKNGEILNHELDNKVWIVKKVIHPNCALPRNNERYLVFEGKENEMFYGTQFMPVPPDFKPVAPNQVYADHIFERITQQLTDQEILDLASRLHRKVEQS